MTDLHRIERTEGSFPVAEMDWDNNLYYAALLDGREYAYLHTQGNNGYDFVMMHITLLRFGPRVLRECREDYKALLRILRESGIRSMVHLKDAPFRKWEKLMRVLGFGPVRNVMIEGQPYKTISMEVN